MAETFRNWSGSVEFTPSSRTRPSDVDDIVDLVNDARTHSRILRRSAQRIPPSRCSTPPTP